MEKNTGLQDGALDRVIKAMLAMQRYPWEQGVCAQALYEAGRDDLWIPMAHDAVKRMDREGRLAMAGGGEAVSDPAANGEVCLRAFEKTGDLFFINGAKRMLEYLLNDAPRTADGVICHNNTSFFEGFSKYQLWIDGMYMVPPFLAVMGELDEAYTQIKGYVRHLFDDENDLFYHIVDVSDGRFVRKVHWATGNGWAVMGLARVIEEADGKGRKDVASELTALLIRVISAMHRYQPADGRFTDILDGDDSFTDGTSSMMFAAAVYRGIVHGYVPEEFGQYAENAYGAVTNDIDEYGILRHVAGCPDFISDGTSAEAQASYIMASARREIYLKG